jgi:phosphohistidine phosphatase
MKRLTLLRHAQAETAHSGHSDFDRVLTRRGMEDAAEMARRLRGRKLQIAYILASTAPRAFTTAELFARTLKIPSACIENDDRLYTAGPNEFLNVLQELNSAHEHILIAAHNPGITEFADKLSNERRIDAMPTCAVATMRFDIANWRDLRWGTGTEVDLDYPARQAD